MLTELQISNLVTIDHLSLEFGPGLTVITGDTGAGKSMLLDALDLVLGGRADFGLVRAGADRTRVDARFEIQPSLVRRLADSGLRDGDDAELFLGRELTASGKGSARIDGRTSPVSAVRAIAANLVDVHGQSDHLSLLQPAEQRSLLDRFAHLEDLRASYQVARDRLLETVGRLQKLENAEQADQRRLDFLRFQIQEIEAAGLSAAEESELQSEHRKLSNMQRLLAAVNEAHAALDADETGAHDLIARAERAIATVAGYDQALGAVATRLADIRESLADCAADLRRSLDSLDDDPARLPIVEDRLEVYARLRKKYGATVEDVLRHGEECERELAAIENRDATIDELRAEVESQARTVGALGWDLFQARCAAAQQLESGVASQLADLGLGRAQFSVAVRLEAGGGELVLPGGERASAGREGIDSVEFQLAVNPGEPLRGLAQVASGGELSRVMLGLKVVLGDAAAVPVLVFDEVDSGVGGRSGEVIGRKLAELAQHHQVLCVTHLPQVACYGDHHLVVSKRLDAGRTVTECRAVVGSELEVELARMLGRESDATIQSARELLQQARLWKDSRRSAPFPVST